MDPGIHFDDYLDRVYHKGGIVGRPRTDDPAKEHRGTSSPAADRHAQELFLRALFPASRPDAGICGGLETRLTTDLPEHVAG